MYLKRLEISGFKSFGTKSVLDFADGKDVSRIAAIVGPNGSGKSNIADSFRWVLGEQSSKLLRSKKSEDVIFCGSSTKARSSYSEISITLADDQPFTFELNNKTHELSEIEISRKLYRSGESEYLINRKKVRLIDLQQLLATLGFGQSSYTVIGQGMVDRMLFFNAAERKTLFDEAAGVKQYELKREQAVRKLEGTDANLIRLKDILSELEPRVVNLRRLVKRAEGRIEIEKELSEIQSRYYSSVEFELISKIASFKTQKDKITAQIETKKIEIEKLEKEIASRQNNPEIAEKQREIEAKIAKTTTERDELLQRVAYIEGQLNQTVQRSQNVKVEKERLETESGEIDKKIEFLLSKIAEAKDELATDEKNKKNLTAELAEIEQKKSDLAAKLNKIDENIDAQAIEKLKTELEELEAKRRDANSRLFEIQQKEAYESSRIKEQENKTKLLAENIEKTKTEIAAIKAELSGKRSEKDSHTALIKSKREELNKLFSEIEKIEKELQELASHVDAEKLQAFEIEVASSLKEYKEFEKEVSVGGKISEKFLGFFKKLEGLFARIDKITKAINTTERERIEEKLRTVRANEREVEVQVNRLIVELERINTQIALLEQKEQQQSEKLAGFEAEFKQISQDEKVEDNGEQKKATQAELEKISRDIEKLTAEIREKSKGIEEKRHDVLTEKSTLHDEETHLRSKIYELDLTIGRKKNTLDNQEREVAGSKERLAEIKNRLEEVSGFSVVYDATLEDELKEKKDSLTRRNETLADLRGELSSILSAQRDQNQELYSLERNKRNLENEIVSVNNEINQIGLEEAKYATRLEGLQEELRVSQISFEKADNPEILEQSAKDMLRIKIENLKRRLETIGGVDPETVAEYEELEKRSSEMTEQVTDLEKAKEDLEKIIKELDVKIKKQFFDTFGHIAEEFNRYFGILFNGGKASLTLGEDEEGNYGIEITANPPGKRVQNLNALSGGERTLTSLALVFAILSINPSPFCVLDEVDAALDESNTLRFAKILKDLTDKTQFLVISHNRETMKAADTLYGITMDSDHVSKLISIRLTEALEVAK